MGEHNEFNPETSDMNQEPTIESEIESLRAMQGTDLESYDIALRNLGAGLPGMGDRVSEADIQIKVELTTCLEEFANASSEKQANLKKQIFELASKYSREGQRGIAILREYFKPEDHG